MTLRSAAFLRQRIVPRVDLARSAPDAFRAGGSEIGLAVGAAMHLGQLPARTLLEPFDGADHASL